MPHTATIPYRFFDPSQPVAFLSGNLPHWRQQGVTYFVTFRLADSVPQIKLREWQQEKKLWIRAHPEPHSEEDIAEFWQRFPERFHRWLDASHGECLLRDSRVKACLEAILRHFDGDHYDLGEYVIMPNHVHAVVLTTGERDISKILHSWKSFSSGKINRLLGRRGRLWQKESFDCIVRSPAQLERINAYIEENPLPKP